MNEPLTRYVQLRVAHGPGMPGTFSPPPASKETACWRSRYASRHVRHSGGENVPGIPGTCTTHNFTYLARGPLVRTCFDVAVIAAHVLNSRLVNNVSDLWGITVEVQM